MKKMVVLLCCALTVALVAGSAAAEDMRGKVAMTARIGVTNPANDEKAGFEGTLLVTTDAGVIGGGGLLFGLDENVAVDVEVTRSAYHAYGFGTAGVTDVSFGAQYRFPEKDRFVPYGAAGLDVLINDLSGRSVDTVAGVHAAVGVDYIALRQVSLNAELRGTEAFSADVRGFAGNKEGKFDPSNVSFTVGARYYFN